MLNLRTRLGLANFNPQEGHTIPTDSPEGRTCAHMSKAGGGGIELPERRYLETRHFFLLLFIKVTVLRSVDLLH
jgi:hypothetical protein